MEASMPKIDELIEKISELEDRIQTLEVDKTFDDRSFKALADAIVKTGRNIRKLEKTVAEGNEGIFIKFAQANSELDKLNKRLVKVENQLDSLAKRMDLLPKQIVEEIKEYLRKG